MGHIWAVRLLSVKTILSVKITGLLSVKTLMCKKSLICKNLICKKLFLQIRLLRVLCRYQKILYVKSVFLQIRLLGVLYGYQKILSVKNDDCLHATANNAGNVDIPILRRSVIPTGRYSDTPLFHIKPYMTRMTHDRWSAHI